MNIKCPQCKGIGSILPAFPSQSMIEAPIEELKEFFKCDMCNGNKEVSDEVNQWQIDGDILKDRRIEKRIRIGQESKLLDIDVSILSKMERGCIKPDMSLLEKIDKLSDEINK